MGLTVVVLVVVLCGIVCSSDAPPPIIPWKSFGAVVGPAKPEVMESDSVSSIGSRKLVATPDRLNGATKELQVDTFFFFFFFSFVSSLTQTLVLFQLGSGLFAREDIPEYWELGSIPLNATISAASLEDIGWTHRYQYAGLDVEHEVVLLASYVLYEIWVDNYQGFAGAYIENLPPDASWAPCMWTSEEMTLAAKFAPSLHEGASHEIIQLKSEYDMFLQFFADKDTWRTTHDITFNDFCYARTMVASRWFGVNDAKTIMDEDGKEKIVFKTISGLTQAHVMTEATYNSNHMVPFIDLFNHRIIRDFDDPTFFAELSTWNMVQDVTPNRFSLRLLRGGGVEKGGEVFITYGSRGIDETLLHYGFLVDIGDEYYEPSIFMPVEEGPLHMFRKNAIHMCWPDYDGNWVQVQGRYLPVEVVQRAMILEERRLDVLMNDTYVKEYFCKSTGMFKDRTLDALRRNKRALLRVFDATRDQLAKFPSQEECDAAVNQPNMSHTMQNLMKYRRIIRQNLATAVNLFVNGKWRLLKQVHMAHG